MKPILETDRLRLKEFALDDYVFIIKLLNSPSWLQFVGDRNVKTEKQAKRYIQTRFLRNYSEMGFGFYLVELKEGNIPIGMCGFIKRDQLECPDIGFAFLPDFTGFGYAYEIVKPTLEYALSILNMRKIAAITLAENERSIRLIKKIGLKYVKTISENGKELLFFCI